MSLPRSSQRIIRLFFVFLGFLLSCEVPGQEISISEIFYLPQGMNPSETWFELHNPSSNTVQLAGWKVTRGVDFTFPPESRIDAGGYLVVAAHLPTFTSLHPSVSPVVGGWNGHLSPGGEEIRIEDAASREIDTVTYAAEGNWAVRRMGVPDALDRQGWEWFAEHHGLGASLERIHPGLPNDDGQNWASSSIPGGTPGQPNSVTETNTAPWVLAVHHAPILPRSSDAVTVTVPLFDDDPVGIQANVFWRLDGEPGFRSTPLRDDGTAGDAMAGDLRFTTRLPAQPHGTLVEFYVVAVDDGGRSRTYPRFDPTGAGPRSTHLLYLVDDTPYSGDQPLFRLLIPQAEYTYLVDEIWNGKPFSDAAVHGTFVSSDGILDGGSTLQVRHLCDFRNRGHGTRTANPHNVHVGFPDDRPWKGRTGLNLNTHYTHSQHFGSALFRRVGIPMPESRPVQVRINGVQWAKPGQEQFGSYAANDPVDDRFVERQFPTDDQGNLYRGIRDMIPGIDSEADLAWLGPDFASYTNAYARENHAYRVDGSDLLRLLDVLHHAPDATYARDVRAVVDVDQWMKYFAVNTLLDNQENCLANGAGDDFMLYRGVRDPRFRLLPYDLDAVLGRGTRTESYADGLWRMTNIAVLDRFMKQPEFAPLYFRHLERLALTTFSAAELNPLLEQLLGGYVPASVVANLQQFAASHVTHVLSRFPRTLTVAHDLPSPAGYPVTTQATLALRGTAHPGRTRAVEIQGRAALWSAWQGTWSYPDLPLHPGLNRLEIRALGFDGVPAGALVLEVLHDDGSVQTAPSSLVADTTWTAAGGPYRISTGLTIPAGTTLTLEPGTTVYLGAGADLAVENGGRLLAVGTPEAPIRFASPPGTTTEWGGLIVRGGPGSPETRLAYVHFDGNGSTCIESSGGTLTLDHLTFGSTAHPYVSLDDSSFVVAHCHFPPTTGSFEPFHGSDGIKSGGRGIIHHCFFGPSRGYSDIIDFTGGNRPDQPILQVYDNVFTGSTDDILDLDGTDAWIEGNIFLHVHRNGAPDSSAAVSGGNSGAAVSEITLVENLFFDCDNAVTAKQGNFYALLHNTIVHTTKIGGEDFDSGVVNLQDTTPDITRFGRGAYLEGNVVVDAENLLRNYDPTESSVTLNHNILPTPWTGPGTDNPVVDPLLLKIPTRDEASFDTWEAAQIMRAWFGLRPGSPARGAGPRGRDLGASGARGAYVSGEPPPLTASPSARLDVGFRRSDLGTTVPGFPQGSGFTHFRWRLDEGPWSPEQTIDAPIVLDGLSDGPHAVEVSGRNDAGTYQDSPEFGPDAKVTRSREWIVDRNHLPPESGVAVRLHEILAHNHSVTQPAPSLPDLIELHNSGELAVDLSGMGLTDHPDQPYRYTFPLGTRIEPGAFLVIAATATPTANLPVTGFGLDQDGDALFLVQTPERGGVLVDSVRFGLQLPDLSIGRRQDGSWGLCTPTFGGPNIARPTGDPRRLRINEWLTHARYAATGDFVELHNPEPLPVELSGLRFSDAAGATDRFVVPELSFVGARGHAVFQADGNAGGADHLPFRLSSEVGILALAASDGSPIDVVNYGSQRTDQSQGRSPDGASALTAFPIPTPGSSNPGNAVGECTETTVTVPLVPMGSLWRYQQTANLDGTGWHLPAYADEGWPSAPALLAVESSSLPAPGKQTELALGRVTYYFRTHFLVETNLDGFRLRLGMVADDGALVFLNGRPVWTNGLAQGNPSYATFANRNVGNATLESVTLPADALVSGTNVIAAEVHQANASSTDIVWGLAAEAVRTFTECSPGTLPTVALDEILAASRPTNATEALPVGFVEIVNFGTEAVALAGMSLSDDPTAPGRWVFPSSPPLPPGERSVVLFDASRPASDTHAGFGLGRSGGAVYLFDSPANGGTLVDAIRYGVQIPDYSIARIPTGSGPWTLAHPTPGTTNRPALLAEPSNLKLNEWLADPESGSDWLEIYNTAPLPVPLAGVLLTDDLADPSRSSVAPLSFVGIDRDAYIRFFADGDPGAGSDHVQFSLKRSGESLAVFTPDGRLVDGLIFGPQATGISQGRYPDGAPETTTFRVPSPGRSNQADAVDADTDADGMDDAWEQEHFGTLARDGTGDFDGDGATDGAEFRSGTSPTEATDVLRFVEISVSVPTVLRFQAKANRSYSVQVLETFDGARNWRRLNDVPPQAADTRVTVTDPTPSPSARFYRIVTPAP